MAKVTPEQKAINKEATKLRDRAFKVRRDEYRAKLESAEAEIKAGDLAKAAQEANQKLDDAIEAKRKEVQAIQDRIEELNALLKATEAKHEQLIDPLKTAWDVSRDQLRAAEREASDAIDAAYPDVARCFYAAAWKSFEEFIPQVSL